MSARSDVQDHPALQQGFGTSRTWRRTIAGRQYRFTAVLMPDGERRYSASRLDGTDARFACSWAHVLFWTAPAPAPALHVRPIRIADGVREANARYQMAKPDSTHRRDACFTCDEDVPRYLL